MGKTVCEKVEKCLYSTKGGVKCSCEGKKQRKPDEIEFWVIIRIRRNTMQS